MKKAIEISMHRIARLLKEMGWSQADLARRIGVSQQTVQQWVSGKSTPKPANLDKLTEVTGHPPYWFMLPQEESNPVLTPDTMKIGVNQRALLRVFNAFPKDEQEKILKEITEKKESMEKLVARWIEAQKDNLA